jgi:protein-S-isoprenylcysteine O-methyltransferase Ste14
MLAELHSRHCRSWHPIYTGQIIGLLASGIAIATWTAMLGVLLISFGEWQKARMEERFLTAELVRRLTNAIAAACR